ncbi:MAG: class IV adenylate cyclase [Spirochaetaceae bacterium]
MYEVELKAWVDDVAALRRRLDERCVFQREFDRRDSYFLAPECAADSQWCPRQFRLRRDDEHVVCTYKQKDLADGVETNLEREFEVSDEQAFRGLIRRLGCTPLVEKRKRGRLYGYRNMNVELSEVEGLGYFVEVEKLLPDETGEADRARAREEVKAALAAFGVSPGRIEERPYTLMLREGVQGR